MTDLEIYSAYLPYEVSIKINSLCDEVIKMTVGNFSECFFRKDKLILRPLSDLRKTDFGSYLSVNYGNTPNFYYENTTNYYKIKKLPYEVIKALLKEHYDILGLIEQEKAININEL